jgi:hypothetical protein
MICSWITRPWAAAANQLAGDNVYPDKFFFVEIVAQHLGTETWRRKSFHQMYFDETSAEEMDATVMMQPLKAANTLAEYRAGPGRSFPDCS